MASPMALLKGKYMPLSEANVSPVLLSAFDGQHLFVSPSSPSSPPPPSSPSSAPLETKREVRYAMGNYLGGGIAGVVYEALDVRHHRTVAIKMLNPIGYKLASPSALRRAEIVKPGVPLLAPVRNLTLEDVYWVKLPTKRELVACYVDVLNGASTLRELTLEMSVALWGLDVDADDVNAAAAPSPSPPRTAAKHSPEDEDEDDVTARLRLPPRPAKYRAFLARRSTIYREIAHMHKLTGNSVLGHIGGGHPNVLRLFDVLELVQASKTTIFLVLELAAGGELFDRIRLESEGGEGLAEASARAYAAQVLAGVRYCHQLGIVHRDLKPENLLLDDADVLKIADFGLSAHVIAAVSSDTAEPEGNERKEPEDHLVMPAARFRRLNSVVGSPHYVAPEILQNARYGYDGRKADMWSIGVILYGLVAGSLPFGKDLQTCARYLKFCEWIRALPGDPQTGKLVFDAALYQAQAPVLPSLAPRTTSPSPSHSPICMGKTLDEEEEYGPTASRLQQVYPHCASPTPSMVLRLSHPVTPAPSSVLDGAAAAGLPPAASARRTSRVVCFPSWFFPARLSPQLVYLLASLLHPEPGKRMACEEACRSAWITGCSKARR